MSSHEEDCGATNGEDLGECCKPCDAGPESDDEEEEEELTIDEDGRIHFEGTLHTNCRSFADVFHFEPDVLEKLANDCQLAFTARAQKRDGDYSEGDTFFVKASEKPVTAIEAMAKAIFEFHTKDAQFDAARSGAEWWAQYIEHEDDIGLHFDKDYSAEEEGVNLFPHIATVTYLSNIGGPTMVLARQGPFIYGSDVSGPVEACHLSLPQVAKHFCFDGRLLHGAPSDLSAFWEEGKGAASESKCRVTLLVNVWLNHIPASAEPASAEMRAQMTPASAFAPTFSADKEATIPSIKVGGTPAEEHTWRFSGEGKLKYDVAIAAPELGSIARSTPTVQLVFENEGGAAIVKKDRKRKREGNAGEEGKAEDGDESESESESDEGEPDSGDSEEENDGSSGSGEEEEDELLMAALGDSDSESGSEGDEDEEGVPAQGELMYVELSESEEESCYESDGQEPVAEQPPGGPLGDEEEYEQDCE